MSEAATMSEPSAASEDQLGAKIHAEKEFEYSRNILSDDSIQWLQSQGEKPLAAGAGMFQIRRISLRGPSSDTSDHESFQIPQKLYSVESLEYCGLTKDMAKSIFRLVDPSLMYSLGIDEKWHLVLTNIGIEQSFHKGIMDPNFKAIRHNQTAKVWAFKVVCRVWDFLKECNKFVQERRRIITADSNPQPNVPLPENATFTSLDEREEVVLYRGGSFTYLKKTLEPDIDPREKRLCIERITSRWIGDFTYFARSTCGAAPAAVLKFTVPVDLLRNSEAVPEDVWSSLVFHTSGTSYREGSDKWHESPDNLKPMDFGETYATQVMFRLKRMDELARRCVDKVEIIDYMKDKENVRQLNIQRPRGLSKIGNRSPEFDSNER
ncbi:hypothetical protein BDZ45DRAFT_810443 [Acephala macrosclerotiorum]|nr:hypothetical protein BDZ45DRAFT_810443 [Acephala macrosclerotiorum]